MKKLFTLLSVFVLTISTFSQVPEKMSYQAVIRDASNALVTNHSIGMRISILQGSTDGTVVYTETQTTTTNANGLVSIEIGGGTGFDAINWSSGSYFIKTETDPTGGTNYTITGTSQLLSVPYALFAKSVKGLLDADNSVISNVSTPVNNNDAVNKAYVDSIISELKLEILANNGVSDIDGNFYSAVKIGNQVWMKQNLRTIRYRNGDLIETTTPAVLDIGYEGSSIYQWFYPDALLELQLNLSQLIAAELGGYNFTQLFQLGILIESQKDMLETWTTKLGIENGDTKTVLEINTECNNISSTLPEYNGRLYTHAVVTDNRKICPTGWHVPTLDEWIIMTGYLVDLLGNEDYVAKSLASDSGWTEDALGNDPSSNNSSGFSALPSGNRIYDGTFDGFGSYCVWWAIANEFPEGFTVHTEGTWGGFGGEIQNFGLSVRCIKDN